MDAAAVIRKEDRMSQMTTLVILLVLIAATGAVFVIMVARETERTHPELGDLPAALLTIFFVAVIGFTRSEVSAD